MNFNFSEAINSQNAAVKPLEGNMIHTVTFDGCESVDINNQNDPSHPHKILRIKFHNDDGEFTHTVWQPRDSDFEPRTSPQGFPSPANVATMVYLFKHLIDAINPEASEKINKGELRMDVTPENWDIVRKFIITNTNSGIGKTTKIKLIKNNKGEAIFPYFLGYNRDMKLYMTTNFIGDNIFFTAKESEKIAKANAAKPTEIKDDFDSVKAPNTDFDDDI